MNSLENLVITKYEKRLKRIKGLMICSILLTIIGISMLLLSGCANESATSEEPFDGEYTEYFCDAKNFKLATTIEIQKNGKRFAEIRGKLFTFVTDPLTLYNAKDQEIAYAGDAYHFIAQDSHSIYVNDQFSAEMVGQVDHWGNTYKIYNEEEELIALAEFNAFNTKGELCDIEGNLIAEYTSNLFANDFTVRISTDCTLDENTVLMIFGSYFSDCHYDSSTSSY